MNTQLSQLSDAANQEFDAVFVIPVDSAGIRQGLQELNDAGVKVINVDTAVIEDDRDLVETVIGTNAYQAGELVGEQMVRDYPDGARIAVLDFPSNESCVDRVDGFFSGLGDNKSKFDIEAQQDGKAALDDSMKLAEDIIQANPDIDAFSVSMIRLRWVLLRQFRRQIKQGKSECTLLTPPRMEKPH